MPKNYLNKTDFSRWMTCTTAAHYGWSDMASKNEDDAFLRFLAEEGQTVRRMARRLFTDAKFIGEADLKLADRITRKNLVNDTVTLFESCIIHDNFVIRPDVLIRKGRTLYIVDVKSKSGDMQQHRKGRMLINFYGDVRAAYKEIAYDLSFQTEVIRHAFPDFEIVPYFLLPESSSRTDNEEVDAARKVQEFTSEIISDEVLRKRRSESVLKFFPASNAISKIRATTESTMAAMHTAWLSKLRPKPQLRYQCRNCESRLKNGNDTADGFHQCWGKLAEPKPHLFELYQLYSLKQKGNKQALLADEKILAGDTSIYGISETELHGEHANRQKLQLHFQRKNEEWIDPKMKDLIGKLQWPIVFLDFETSMAAIPWYTGLKPYEVLPFQFSAHILYEDGRMKHREWLNTEDRIPTLYFIRALQRALEGTGSVLVYTDYENRILKEAISFLARHAPISALEREWTSDLLNSGRIVDQHEWILQGFIHPRAVFTSIKKVLPAVWKTNTDLHHHYYFKRYYAETSGSIIDPYKTLPSESIGGLDYEVREGCGAMQIYREMIRGIGASNPTAKEQLAELLRNYVALDTASQWIIFEHLTQQLGISNRSPDNLKIQA